MRLIDADKINPMRCPQSIEEMREWIDSQPTAYDVEAVMDELNAKGNEFFVKAVNAEIKGECLFAEICKMAAAAVYESADIVMRGGRNEEPFD